MVPKDIYGLIAPLYYASLDGIYAGNVRALVRLDTAGESRFTFLPSKIDKYNGRPIWYSAASFQHSARMPPD
jgi:hypothetical protein